MSGMGGTAGVEEMVLIGECWYWLLLLCVAVPSVRICDEARIWKKL